MEQYKSKRTGMIAGYKVLLYAGVGCVLFFLIARSIVKREIKKLKQSLSQRDNSDVDNLVDISKDDLQRDHFEDALESEVEPQLRS